MKKTLTAVVIFTAISAFSQIDTGDKNKPESSTQGIFVNDGSIKLSSLDCYDFENMQIAFDIDDSYFTYDVIQVKLLKTATQDANADNIYWYNFSKEEFARKFKGKKYAYLELFPQKGLDQRSVMGFSRARLQLVYSKKDKETTKLYVHINGGVINGRTAFYDPSSNSTKYNDTYKFDRLTKLVPVPMHNAFVARNFVADPTMPTITGNCYK